jgi:SAM-dependent methyltransferase
LSADKCIKNYEECIILEPQEKAREKSGLAPVGVAKAPGVAYRGFQAFRAWRAARRFQKAEAEFKNANAEAQTHFDIGGEGKYPDAVNVNPNETTTTTGAPGRTIPNLLKVTGEELSAANASADIITVENAPISAKTASQIARVIKPGGQILLESPAGYATTAHQRVIDAIGRGARAVQQTTGVGETAVTKTIIKVAP